MEKESYRLPIMGIYVLFPSLQGRNKSLKQNLWFPVVYKQLDARFIKKGKFTGTFYECYGAAIDTTQ